MVKIFPFKGISYNKKKLKKIDRLVTPPYDVISEEEQDYYYDLHDFNIIKIILGKTFPGDGEYNNKYIRAAAFFDGWLRHEILAQEEKPTIYIYEQKFSYKGKTFTRLGFISLLRLEEFGRGKVYPHEETFAKAKLDRLQLMRATNANLEPLFSIYSDPKDKVTKILKQFTRKKPYFEVKDQNKITNRIWKLDRKPSINRLVKEMKDKPVFIADGHHRYEAALRYKSELKRKNTKFVEDEAYNHVMMYFTSMENKGLLILPIHRVVFGLQNFDPLRFEVDLKQFFEVEILKGKPLKKVIAEMHKRGQKSHVFGMYLGNKKYYLLTLKDESVVEALVSEDKPAAWKQLDTTILNTTIFQHLLAIGNQSEDHIKFVKNEEEAIKLVDDKKAQIAFLLNPCNVGDLAKIAEQFEKMPQKTTFFYPKLLTGLVINKFNHADKILL